MRRLCTENAHQVLRHHARRRCAPQRRARHRRDRIRVHAREPALRRHQPGARDPRRAAAVRAPRSRSSWTMSPAGSRKSSRACSPTPAVPRRRERRIRVELRAARISRPCRWDRSPMLARHVERVSRRRGSPARQPRARRARRHGRNVRLDARPAGHRPPVRARRRPERGKRGGSDRNRATLRRGRLQRHRIGARHQGRRRRCARSPPPSARPMPRAED